jgi:hypothetical protein
MGLDQKSYLMKCNSQDTGARYRPIGNINGETNKETRFLIQDLLMKILNWSKK